MSDIKVRNAIWRCIQRRIASKLWESGYVDGSEPHGHLMLWSPTKPKAFSKNEVITQLWAIGKDWIADNTAGGGMATVNVRRIPVSDLANVLEWLLSIDIDAKARVKRKAA